MRICAKFVSDFVGGGTIPLWESLSQSDHEHGQQRQEDGDADNRTQRELEKQSVSLLMLTVVHRRMALGWVDMHSTPLML
jgi:hypothetical protein